MIFIEAEVPEQACRDSVVHTGWRPGAGGAGGGGSGWAVVALVGSLAFEDRLMVGLILAHQRCGSSELTRALRTSTPSSLAIEPFHKAMRKRGLNFDHPDFPAYFDQIMSLPGFKHMWNGMREDQNEKVLGDPRVRGVVFLYREDVTKAALSTIVARKTKHWRDRPEKPGRLPLDQIEAKRNEILAGQRRYREWLFSKGIPHMLVRYEDLYDLEKTRWLVKTIAEFLELGPLDLERAAARLSPSRRYSSDDFYRSAPNWPEFEARFS